MNSSLHLLRKEYRLQSLDRGDLHQDPFTQFKKWLAEAKHAQVLEPNAMTLATVSASGTPSCRTVLLKGIDPNGFLFYTNYESRKGQELAENPQACLCFLWKELERQVIIGGCVEKLSFKESASYFGSRPRGSQLGAWISKQSQPISSREILEKEYVYFQQLYEGIPIPLPPYWGGYRLLPNRFEFWQGRENRLHDRFSYLLNDKGWNIERLAP